MLKQKTAQHFPSGAYNRSNAAVKGTKGLGKTRRDGASDGAPGSVPVGNGTGEGQKRDCGGGNGSFRRGKAGGADL